MRIAIIGSRDYPRLPAVSGFVQSLPKDATVVTGGARGVDEQAERAARAFGLKVSVLPVDPAGLPEDEKERRIAYAKRAYARNAVIVASADRVVAFWAHCRLPGCQRPRPHRTHGTEHALSEARRLRKPVMLFGPTGSMEEEL